MIPLDVLFNRLQPGELVRGSCEPAGHGVGRKIARRVPRLNDVLAARVGGVVPAREFDVDLAMVVAFAVMPCK